MKAALFCRAFCLFFQRPPRMSLHGTQPNVAACSVVSQIWQWSFEIRSPSLISWCPKTVFFIFTTSRLKRECLRNETNYRETAKSFKTTKMSFVLPKFDDLWHAHSWDLVVLCDHPVEIVRRSAKLWHMFWSETGLKTVVKNLMGAQKLPIFGWFWRDL